MILSVIINIIIKKNFDFTNKKSKQKKLKKIKK